MRRMGGERRVGRGEEDIRRGDRLGRDEIGRDGLGRRGNGKRRRRTED